MREVGFDPDLGILREGLRFPSASNRNRRDTPSLPAETPSFTRPGKLLPVHEDG